MTDEIEHHESAEREAEVVETAQEEKPAKRFRLLARAQMHGEVRDPGYVFTLEDGVLGPHRTVMAHDAGINLADHMNDGMPIRDVPLYEEIDEDGKRIEPEADRAEVEHAEVERAEDKPLLLEGPVVPLPSQESSALPKPDKAE